MRIAPQHRVFAGFFLFAVAIGAMLSRLPDIQRDLQLTESQLGLTLIAMAIGSLISLTLSTPWIVRLGARTTAFATVIGTALCYAIVPWLPHALLVFPVLVAAGLLAGMLEINLNLQAARIEAQLGRRVMNRAHGFWSLGFFLTALAGAAIRQTGISPELHTAMAFGLVALVSIIMFSGMRDAPVGQMSEANAEHRFTFPNLGLVPLCIIGLTAFFVEGAGVDWSLIYMRDTFTVSAFVGGLSLSLFAGTMTIGRLFADPVVDRLGPRVVATSLLAIAGVGAMLIALAPHPYLALFGFALLGLGCSVVYPLAVSGAAERTDRPAAVNVAALAQVSYGIFFLGPPMLGFVAEHWGIRLSYVVVVPMIVWAALLCGSLTSPKPTTGAKVAPADA
ncbi:MAG: MFS transporter [Devosia sp.]